MKKKNAKILYITFLSACLILFLSFSLISLNTYKNVTKYLLIENKFFSRVNNYDKSHLDMVLKENNNIYTYYIDGRIFELNSEETNKFVNRPKTIVREGGFYVYYNIENPIEAIVPFYLTSKNTYSVIISIIEVAFFPALFLTFILLLIKYRKKIVKEV